MYLKQGRKEKIGKKQMDGAWEIQTVDQGVELRFGWDKSWLEYLVSVYNQTDLKRPDSKKVARAFAASQVVITAWKNDSLVGAGRALTDFEMYASIFDIVINPTYQKQGIGKLMMEGLLKKLSDVKCIHLTSTFGNEGFYSKFGFLNHKTAMALYKNQIAPSPYLEELK